MSLRYTAPFFEWIDGDGVPAAGWKLYFYASGTSTPLATYSDPALTVANTNPVIANADGWWGAIYLKALDYKVVLTDANDVLIWTADPVSGSGGQNQAIRTVTTNFTIATTDGTILCNNSGLITGTLPDPTQCTGVTFTVKNINTTGTVVLSGQVIDGASSYFIGFYNQSVDIRSTGANFVIV